LVLMEEEENEIRSMMERLEKYLERKKVDLNREKTKIVRFRKGGMRERKKDWRWKGRRIEEVLLRDKIPGVRTTKEWRAGGASEGQGEEGGGDFGAIGKKRFGRDWGRRLWLFDRLVWTVMGYWVEV